jgi:hypothetical protein
MPWNASTFRACHFRSRSRRKSPQGLSAIRKLRARSSLVVPNQHLASEDDQRTSSRTLLATIVALCSLSDSWRLLSSNYSRTFGYRHQFGLFTLNFAKPLTIGHSVGFKTTVNYAYFSETYTILRKLKIRRRQLHEGSIPSLSLKVALLKNAQQRNLCFSGKLADYRTRFSAMQRRNTRKSRMIHSGLKALPNFESTSQLA